MPTPMRIYDDIAKSFGVDDADEVAVEKFYTETLPGMSEVAQEEILQRLFDHNEEGICEDNVMEDIG